jgi:hypothetical protein
VAPNPDRELGEARAALDRGDGLAAVRRLDRARQGYVKRRDPEGLEHVLDMAHLIEPADERARIGRENLTYSVKQNLRHESRRAARERKQAWVDPYPDLQAPTEHTGIAFTRRVKVVIGIGVLLGTLAIVAVIAAIALVDTGPTSTVTLRLVNDTGQTLTVRGCDDSDCVAPWMDRRLQPGLRTEAAVDADKLVELFKVGEPGPDECLPVRVHDGYVLFGGGSTELAVRLSQATPCPGTTVLPRPVRPTQL